MNKHYKYLFLSMSCNIDPFFEISRKVVHDTWARDLIKGKYEDCGFFSYTTALNHVERIEDNCVYVDTLDDVNHTYSKTMRALKLLKEAGITWDVIVRTNTSTFINVDNILTWLVQFDKDSVWGFVPGKTPLDNGLDLRVPIGWMLLLPSKLTDFLLEHEELNENSSYMNWIGDYLKQGSLIQADDVLFGLFTLVAKHEYGLDVEVREIPRRYVAHYRTSMKNHFLQPPLHESYTDPNEYYDIPNQILNLPFIQVRKFAIPNFCRYIECEEMYELQQTIDQNKAK